jgi:hypothetical protein
MPSITHQFLVTMLREAPALITHLFELATGKPLPAGASTTLTSAQFTDVEPPEYSADAAHLIKDPTDATLGTLILEAQLSPSEGKHRSWLQYVATQHAKSKRPVTVVVLAIDEPTERWCAEPHIYDHVGSAFRPVVIGPSMIPRITDIAQARALPELAVLSAMAHSADPDVEHIGLTALAACESLDSDQGRRYGDFISAWLFDVARITLRKLMAQQGYEYVSEFARQFVAEGRKEGIEEGEKKLLVKQLARKFGELSAEVRERIEAASSEQVDLWGERVLTAQSIEQVFAEP